MASICKALLLCLIATHVSVGDKSETNLVSGELYEEGLLAVGKLMKVQRIKQLGGYIHGPAMKRAELNTGFGGGRGRGVGQHDWGLKEDWSVLDWIHLSSHSCKLLFRSSGRTPDI